MTTTGLSKSHLSSHHDRHGDANSADRRASRIVVERHESKRNGVWHQSVPDSRTQRFVTWLTILAGIALTMSPLLWVHGTGEWLAAGLNEIVTGFIVMLSGLLRLTRSVSLLTVTSIGCTISAWLIVSPVVLDVFGYRPRGTSMVATIVVFLVGLFLWAITVAGASYASSEGDRGYQ